MHVLIIAKDGKSISYGNPNFRNKYIAQGPDSAQPTDIFEGVLWVDSPGVQYPSMDNVFHDFDFCCFSKIDKANAFDEESNGFTVKMQWSPAGKLDSSQAKIVYDIIDSYKQTPRYKDASGQHNYYQGIYEMSEREFMKITLSKDDFLKYVFCTSDKFVIFDEMNLARVEYYLADILSAMELGEASGIRLDRGENTKELVVPWRDDLVILGTANMDETTYSFSPKVLDRSFYIKYSGSDIELDKGDDEKEIKAVAERFNHARDYFVGSKQFKGLLRGKNLYGWPDTPPAPVKDSIPCALAAAVATKGFVILGGLSGAGKTRLSTLFANNVLGSDKFSINNGDNFENPLILSVRPDWRDGSSVIGYYNAITQKRKETPFSKMLTALIDCGEKSQPAAADDKSYKLMKKISNAVKHILKQMNVSGYSVSFGYRAYHEIAAFIFNYLLMTCQTLPPNVKLYINPAFKNALSWAVVMKMLPKFHGSKESIEVQLESLKKILEAKHFRLDKSCRAIRDIDILQKELDSNDYAIYA